MAYAQDPSSSGAAPASPSCLAESKLPGLLARVLFRPAIVEENRPLPGGLHLVTMQGSALRGVRWQPGDKLRVRLGAWLAMRTYSPVEWDPDVGRTRIVGHALASGPGSAWIRGVQAGQALEVFGPQRSLALGSFDPSDAVVVGDETAIGLAAAWKPRHVLLEVGACRVALAATAGLGFHALGVERRPDDGHFDTLIETLRFLHTPRRCYVVVGRAAMVAYVRQSLRGQGIRRDRLLAKAYWADGRPGLD